MLSPTVARVVLDGQKFIMINNNLFGRLGVVMKYGNRHPFTEGPFEVVALEIRSSGAPSSKDEIVLPAEKVNS